jgi:hypothetical protein
MCENCSASFFAIRETLRFANYFDRRKRFRDSRERFRDLRKRFRDSPTIRFANHFAIRELFDSRFYFRLVLKCRHETIISVNHTRRYKSFKSEVGNLPPFNCTIGLKSGGVIG